MEQARRENVKYSYLIKSLAEHWVGLDPVKEEFIASFHSWTDNQLVYVAIQYPLGDPVPLFAHQSRAQ